MNRWLLLSVPLAPFLTAGLALFWGRRLAGGLACAGSLISLIALLALAGQAVTWRTAWAQSGGYTLTLGLTLSPLSYGAAVLVAVVALGITVYALAHMAEERDRPRFFGQFSFFTGAMLTLVLADSWVLLFAAWEAVGLASFLLIGFWYHQEEARKAAQQAFLITRLGDLGFLLAWLFVLRQLGGTDIGAFLSAVERGDFSSGELTLLAFLFFAGAAGKSAQLPLTAWLPSAMVGPTPVSALIHSATMVAAGVYLLLRLFPLFAASPVALEAILWLGVLTALLAALIATVQSDFKRILAWSTASQLGEMMLALGLGGALAAAYHLATHAFFKATLFLTAGAVDHATGSRDIHRLGGLGRRMPVTALIFGAAALALAGIPPFSGFWSEEMILAEAAERGVAMMIIMLLLLFLAGVYISRLGTAVFAPWPKAPAKAAGDPGKLMQAAMVSLALPAAFAGWLLSGSMEALLPFSKPHGAPWFWRILAVTAGLGGMAWGAWRVLRHGPIAALGSFPRGLETGLARATQGAAFAVLALSRATDRFEAGIDALALNLGRSARRFAKGADRLESGFDALALNAGRAVQALADGSEVAEDKGFSRPLDGFAALFSQSGRWLRQLQTGKLYLYTLGLFCWLLLTALVSVLVWIGAS